MIFEAIHQLMGPSGLPRKQIGFKTGQEKKQVSVYILLSRFITPSLVDELSSGDCFDSPC
jgi:hypothetical protein